MGGDTGWPGLHVVPIGSALKGLQTNDPDRFDQVVKIRASSRFLRFVLTNAETSISSAERSIMILYAELCPSDEHVKSVFNRILEEFDLAGYMLKEVLGDAPGAVYADASDSSRCAPCSSYAAGGIAATMARSACCE